MNDDDGLRFNDIPAATYEELGAELGKADDYALNFEINIH